MAEEGPGIISGPTAINLLMVDTPAEFQRLARNGWFKSIGGDRWRLVDVVQGMIRSLRASREECTAEELGRLLDLTPIRLSQLAAQGILPKNRRGFYPLTPSVQAYVRYQREQIGDGGDKNYSRQRARLTKNKADIAEMERSRLIGDLIPKQDMIAANTSLAATIRTRLLAVASKYAPRLVMIRNAAEVEAILRPGIEEALEELSQLEVILDPIEPSVSRRRRARDVDDVETAGETDGL